VQQVRDKILGMIEDYACSLEHQPSFKETYETLVVSWQTPGPDGALYGTKCWYCHYDIAASGMLPFCLGSIIACIGMCFQGL